MANFPTKILRKGNTIIKKDLPEKEEGKHPWSWNEELICSRECIVEYVVEKKRTLISAMVERLSAKLPVLKKGSIKKKIQNIKHIFTELKVENTLNTSPLAHYSPQNMEAVIKILEQRKIPFKK